MKLILASQLKALKTNWTKTQEAAERGTQIDVAPVIKLFCPWGAATWLLTEVKPGEPNILFGLCDMGMGCPEIGYVSLSELEAIRGPGRLKIERDIHFKAAASLAVYAEAARRAQQITERTDALVGAYQWLKEDAKTEGTTSIGFLIPPCGAGGVSDVSLSKQRRKADSGVDWRRSIDD